MIQRQSVRVQLFFTFGLILLIGAGASVFSVITIRNLRSSLVEGVAAGSRRLDDSRRITIAVSNMRSAMRGISLFALMNNPAQLEKARKLYETASLEVRDAVGDLKLSGLAAADREGVDTILSSLARWDEEFPRFADLSANGQGADASMIALRDFTPAMDAIQQHANELGTASRSRQEASRASAELSASTGERLILIFTIVLLLCGAGAHWIINKLVRTLKNIGESVAASAGEVNASSDLLAETSASLAQSMTEQAASVEETSAAALEVSTTAKQTQTSTAEAAELTAGTIQQVSGTQRLLEKAVASMAAIDGSSKKISQIISVIEGIAFQTNILALNAAVEAARAGEHGLGFAVVADEVRSLAKRSAEAASDTSALIGESIENAREGDRHIGELSAAMKNITGQTAQVDQLVQAVNAASREQAIGIEQIAKAMTQIDQVTQRSAAGAEEESAASHELKEQARELSELAGRLSMLTGSASAAGE